jgi:hypothetical protein
VDLEQRRRYYKQCKDEPLTPDDPRNLDLDALPEPHPRGGSWMARLHTRIELADEPTMQLVTGLPGTGKSTELLRLKDRLEAAGGLHMLVVLVDAEDQLDLTQPIDVPDLLATVVDQAERAVLEAEGKSGDAALQDSYLHRLWKWLGSDISLRETQFSVANVATLTLEMKARPDLRRRVREIISSRVTEFVGDVRSELQALDARARVAGYSGLAVIVDSLEKLRGISTNWDEVLRSAERIFGSEAPFLRLPVPVVYTVPAALITRQVGQVEFLPMIKLRHRDGSPFREGAAAVRELVRRRIDDPGLTLLLGDGFEAHLEEVIAHSGGYPREVFQTLQWLLETPTLPADERDLHRRFSEVRDRLEAATTGADLEWLARVATHHTLQIADDAHRDAVDRALRNHLVLRYANDAVWYDLHPAVRQIPGVSALLPRAAP